MKMKNKLMNIIGTAAIFTATITGNPGQASAGLEGNIETIHTKDSSKSYVRPNLLFTLPNKIRGTAFEEFYHDQKHYGKVTLSKEIVKPVSIITRAVYGSQFPTRYAIGASANIFKTENSLIKIFALPYFVDGNGKHLSDKNVAGLLATTNIGDFVLSISGEIKTNTKNGKEWSYGEACVEWKTTPHFSLGYIPSLENDGAGKLTPKIRHRIAGKYIF